jgi:hypothetical protein
MVRFLLDDSPLLYLHEGVQSNRGSVGVIPTPSSDIHANMALPRRISTECFSLLLCFVISATTALLAVSLLPLASAFFSLTTLGTISILYGCKIGEHSLGSRASLMFGCAAFEIDQSRATVFLVGIDLFTKYLGFPHLVMLFYRDIEVNPPLDGLRLCHIIREIWCLSKLVLGTFEAR